VDGSNAYPIGRVSEMEEEVFEVTCGCTARALYPLDIAFCPLHAKAQEMYDLILEMPEELENAGYIVWPRRIRALLKEIDNG